MKKVLYCFYKIILKSTRESKTSQTQLSTNESALAAQILRATKGARNPNLNVTFTNACAAVV